MAHHILEMPITEEKARSLKIGDTVTLEQTLFGIRDATLIHMFDKGRETKFDLDGHAVIHTAPNVHRVPVSNEAPVGYKPFCIGTTTSMRMERFTHDLMDREGVRLIIGKGGMGPDTLKAFAEFGGAYLAIVGGAAALETTWIEQIVDIDMDDLHPESLWKFQIRNFGPLLVGMDSHGGSLYADLQKDVASRRDAVLKSIGAV
ncbi:fumarate hydratase C-terminal domain-containing protein [Afipia felis]|jgi:L(+)-tartrate dehydratase beta subunit|uniref:L(+)-tartrate dehydratase subunit beta n=2 Tax=Afipia felis TaxID=1035 RepID=A0A380W9P0_AFIFE|nr:fumarate hydratase C-terminal domain-containing protein [Afipia felis]EKS28915.1 hydrolyase, tartrate beta subunit/fumarate domain-containing protein, Fe-S type [Afipia felis ATCC 53690]SUU77623.1 L(+)-tartrate dehydratase subunit beta [Afipia felis]SUU85688.1 L(+)-tartrate dehydratase subunit beta [Afipia felis]